MTDSHGAAALLLWHVIAEACLVPVQSPLKSLDKATSNTRDCCIPRHAVIAWLWLGKVSHTARNPSRPLLTSAPLRGPTQPVSCNALHELQCIVYGSVGVSKHPEIWCRDAHMYARAWRARGLTLASVL